MGGMNMTAKKAFDAFWWTLFAIFVACLVVDGISFMTHDARKNTKERCVGLGERLGYETELIGGYCYIKIRPGLKVREDQVLDFLPVIDCR